MNARERKGIPRGGSSRMPMFVSSLSEFGARARKLKRLAPRLARKSRLLGIRARRRLVGEGNGGMRPENIVWIFGAGRTGSTWLSRMMGEIDGHAVWFEPWVGALFDPNHLRLEDRKGEHYFILASEFKRTWLGSIRRFVLDGALARFPGVSGEGGYLVIKEPGGSAGAPLLTEALPESRVVLLVRDPRDVVASWMDARREGGWRRKDANGDKGENKETLADKDPDAHVRQRAKSYMQNVGGAKRAYDLHAGPKALVRYEELRADALGTMRRLYAELGVPVSEEQLARAVDKHAWESIPDEQKGEGKFYRKAKPGGWREDLTPEQAETVERITTPLLEELYPQSSRGPR